jgi:hypothetical protein
MYMPSHAGDSATRSDLAAARCGCLVTLVTVLLNHAGDGAPGVTSPWHDAYAESCWRQCCQGVTPHVTANLVTVLKGLIMNQMP